MGRKTEQQKIQDGKDLESEKNFQTNYEKFQRSVFCFMEQPKNRLAIGYHITNLMFILASVVISVLSTVQSLEANVTFNRFTFVFEIGLLIWFTLEYIFRAWSCSVLKRFRGWRGRLKFLKNFYMCVDAFIIISTFVTSLLQVERSYFTILRATRFLQVFRILRLDRQKGDLKTMFQVVRNHHRELLTCYFASFIILFGGSYVVYLLESGAPGCMITDMVNGLYWGFITVTSVGFGDLSPVTWSGKFFTGIYALVGCAFFALPAGILGSGFAIQVAKQKSQQYLFKIRHPAALLIQTTWRTYTTKREKIKYQATWDNLLPLITGNVQWPGYYSCLPGIKAICNSKEFAAYNLAPQNPALDVFQSFDPESFATASGEKSSSETRKRGVRKPNTTIIPRRMKVNTTLKKDASKLAKYKAAIQFIMRLKYWTCIKRFRKERYPFVELTDIRDKNTQWHLETISCLREMKTTTTNLRVQLRSMKVALHEKIVDAPMAVKRRRLEENEDIDEG